LKVQKLDLDRRDGGQKDANTPSPPTRGLLIFAISVDVGREH
jgi:hypothetical protein